MLRDNQSRFSWCKLISLVKHPEETSGVFNTLQVYLLVYLIQFNHSGSSIKFNSVENLFMENWLQENDFDFFSSPSQKKCYFIS